MAAGSAVVGADGVLPVGAVSDEGVWRYIINSWIPTTGTQVAVVEGSLGGEFPSHSPLGGNLI